MNVKFVFYLLLVMYIGNVDILSAAINLKLNPNLNNSTDSDDGPLITGERMNDAKINRARPYFIIFYHRECYNSKRQAKRTVELYEKFKDKVEFIVIDVEEINNRDQIELKKRYYINYIPHVTIINSKGKVLYDRSGEVGVDKISKYFESSIGQYQLSY